MKGVKKFRKKENYNNCKYINKIYKINNTNISINYNLQEKENVGMEKIADGLKKVCVSLNTSTS